MPTAASLCSGAGMLDIALASLLPIDPRWHAETDPAAAKVHSAHWPDVPNVGDIAAADWEGVEPAEILHGGVPCQGWSVAGARKGSLDNRDLWPVRKVDASEKPRRGALDAIQALRPRLFVLENVPGLLTAEDGMPFGTILADLDGLGYAASWTVVGACRVGACHHRHRLFLAAVPSELVAVADRPAFLPSWWRSPTGWRPCAGTLFGNLSVSWPQAGFLMEGHAWSQAAPPCGAPDALLLPTPTARDATRGAGWGDKPGRPLSEVAALLSDGLGAYEAAVRRQEHAFGVAAPSPTEPGRLGRPRLASAFSEWMMGAAEGWITDLVGREDAVRIAGNGVVWQAAAYALPLLPTFRAFVASLAVAGGVR